MGDTRSRKLLKRLKAAEVGQIIIRGRLRKRALDIWAYDNGAYEDFKAQREFDGETFLADLRTVRDGDGPKPDFIVLPDRVGAGIQSLVMSIEWHRRLKKEGLDQIAPLYFAVQDGMCVVDVPFETVDGIFLGGTLPWKLANAADYAFAAKARKRPFHYARCGTRRRVMHAMALRADSLDSCLPLWSKDKCRVFLDALAQEMLFHDVPEETPKPPKWRLLGPEDDKLRP